MLDSKPQFPAIREVIGRDFPRSRIIKADVTAATRRLRSRISFLLRNTSDKLGAIVHTAAILSPGVSANPELGLRVNLFGTRNMLEMARAFDCKYFLFASNASVYSVFAGDDYSERLDENAPVLPATVYSLTKLAGESLVRETTARYGLPSVSMRLANVFGPWSGRLNSSGPRIFRKLVERIARGRSFTIKTSWHGARAAEWVYSKDVGSFVAAAMSPMPKSFRGEVFNVGSGRILGLHEIARIAKRYAAGSNVNFVFENRASGYRPQVRALDIEKAKKYFAYKPTATSFAIRDYLHWTLKRGGGAHTLSTVS